MEEIWAFARAIWNHLAVFQLNVNFGLARREGHYRMASVFVLLVEAGGVIAVAGVIVFILPMRGETLLLSGVKSHKVVHV